MRFVPLVLVVALFAGCGEDDEAAAPQGSFADLVVEVDADGEGGNAPERRTVRCETADEPPCRGFDAQAFEPTPRGTACTQLFGGPQTATVSGTWDGERIDARFSRNNGCEIARWKEAEPLLGRP
jgi:hypothetical protein